MSENQPKCPKCGRADNYGWCMEHGQFEIAPQPARPTDAQPDAGELLPKQCSKCGASFNSDSCPECGWQFVQSPAQIRAALAFFAAETRAQQPVPQPVQPSGETFTDDEMKQMLGEFRPLQPSELLCTHPPTTSSMPPSSSASASSPAPSSTSAENHQSKPTEPASEGAQYFVPAKPEHPDGLFGNNKLRRDSGYYVKLEGGVVFLVWATTGREQKCNFYTPETVADLVRQGEWKQLDKPPTPASESPFISLGKFETDLETGKVTPASEPAREAASFIIAEMMRLAEYQYSGAEIRKLAELIDQKITAALSAKEREVEELREELEKFRSAASVLCGAHIGTRPHDNKCPMCETADLRQVRDHLSDSLTRKRQQWAEEKAAASQLRADLAAAQECVDRLQRRNLQIKGSLDYYERANRKLESDLAAAKDERAVWSKTCIHHTDAERAAIICPVCLAEDLAAERAKREAADCSTKSRALAWTAIAAKLEEINPRAFSDGVGTGTECALRVIDDLRQKLELVEAQYRSTHLDLAQTRAQLEEAKREVAVIQNAIRSYAGTESIQQGVQWIVADRDNAIEHSEGLEEQLAAVTRELSEANRRAEIHVQNLRDANAIYESANNKWKAEVVALMTERTALADDLETHMTQCDQNEAQLANLQAENAELKSALSEERAQFEQFRTAFLDSERKQGCGIASLRKASDEALVYFNTHPEADTPAPATGEEGAK